MKNEDSVVIEWLVPSLSFLAVMFLGGAVLSARSYRRDRLQRRLAGHDDVYDEPAAGSARSSLARVLGAIGAAVSVGQVSRKLRENLTRAGWYDRNAPLVYLGAKVFLLVGAAAGLALLVPLGLSFALTAVMLLSGAAMAFFIPNLVVDAARRKRKAEIQHHLPDAIDLLEVCVSAGMSMEMAWNLVAEEVRRVSANLADEMGLTSLETHLGATRAEAMRHMSERTQVDEIDSLVSVMVQSERFGTSIADALRTFANFMRERRASVAEESSEKMAVKLILPMVLFIFPVIFIVLVGPAGIRLASVLSSQ